MEQGAILMRPGWPGGDLRLAPGAELVARVAAVGPGGAGVLAVAGVLVPARLPSGVRRGQTLRLRVGACERGRVELRVVDERSAGPAAHGLDAYA